MLRVDPELPVGAGPELQDDASKADRPRSLGRPTPAVFRIEAEVGGRPLPASRCRCADGGRCRAVDHSFPEPLETPVIARVDQLVVVRRVHVEHHRENRGGFAYRIRDMMKNIWKTLSVLAFVAALIAGCTRGGGGATSAPGGSTTPASAAPASAAPASAAPAASSAPS